MRAATKPEFGQEVFLLPMRAATKPRQKSKPNLESAGGRLRMGRYALITPKPESAARGTLIRPAPTQGAAGLDGGSRKVQPAATKAASRVQPAATKAA